MWSLKMIFVMVQHNHQNIKPHIKYSHMSYALYKKVFWSHAIVLCVQKKEHDQKYGLL